MNLMRRVGKVGMIGIVTACGVCFLLVLGAALLAPSEMVIPTLNAGANNLAAVVSPMDSQNTVPTEIATIASTNTPLPTNTIVPSSTPLPTNTVPPTNTPLPTNTAIPPTPIPPIVFSSNTEGMQPVIGPIDIPTGFYEVTATTNGFFIGEIETVGGTCTTGTMGLFNLSQGIANAGAETWFASENCRALIQVSNTQEAWTLEFRAMGASDVQPVQSEYNSSTEGLYTVIGPVIFESGRYRATVTTSGFLIGDVETVSGTCDAGIMGLFNLSQGQANTGAQNLMTSRDCVGLIIISNTQQPWTLAFELLE
jgi:hypothetical protein